MKVWKVADLAQANVETIVLRDKRERIIKELSGTQMALLYAVQVAMEEAAELNATLYLLEGKDPNAFATIGKENEDDPEEHYVMGINFAMLDLLGLDMDAAAAIIGHELAHLKLKHIDEKKEAQKRNPNNTGMFSAAATKYTRDNERESDYLGVIWAVEAGYDPLGAVRLHEQLYKLAKRRPGSFGGSHPSSIERITVLKSLARRFSR